VCKLSRRPAWVWQHGQTGGCDDGVPPASEIGRHSRGAGMTGVTGIVRAGTFECAGEIEWHARSSPEPAITPPRRCRSRGLLFAIALAAAAHVFAQHQAPVESKRFMVVAANPLAVDAGYDVLRNGGTAVDAAIAVQLVLGLVEPQSSGLGGGAFMLAHDAKRRKLVAYDGRETAPAAAKPDRFLDRDGKPLSFLDAIVGGRSVGVPGVVALLAEAHKQQGYSRYPLKAGRTFNSASLASTCCSSSQVVPSGRIRPRSSSNNSRTTRPLRRNFSISAGDLQIIMQP